MRLVIDNLKNGYMVAQLLYAHFYFMGMPPVDIKGLVSGKLKAVSPINHNGIRKWECLCECGNIKIATASDIKKGKIKSCGCSPILGGHTTHGLSKTPEYQIYYAIMSRCYYEKNSAYHNYGGRGIKMCERWLHSFENFYNDMGKRPSPIHSIEKINNDGDYGPDNCKWATPFEQARNTRKTVLIEYNGITYVLADLAKELNIPPQALGKYLKKMNIYEAINYYKNRRRNK